MVSTPTGLAALLQSHVRAPESSPSDPVVPNAAPEVVALEVPSPAYAGVGAPAVIPSQEVFLPEASFARMAREGGSGGAAEEVLLDKLIDRLQARMREESIRRFGLSGGES